MSEAVDVAIVGAGPVGLALALGLARQGVRSVVLEREAALRPFSRAPAVLPRTLEVFRSWGVLDRFLARGAVLERAAFHVPGRREPEVLLDLGVLAEHTATPWVLVLPQDATERILLEAAVETGLVDVRFGHEVVGLREDPDGVTVELRRGGALRARWLVGCDGAHSTVREGLGWKLEGKTYPTRVALVDVAIEDDRDELPWPRVVAPAGRIVGALRYDPGRWRLLLPVPAGVSDEVATSPDHVAHVVGELFGPGPYEPLWASVFRIHCRTSPHFRRGRVLLAGDAAHINSPAGGQGMNGGIHDAHNLAWKLARALRGGSDALLASYEEERRAAVIRAVDGWTDLLTRAAILSPRWMRAGILRLAKLMLSSPRIRLRAALRAAMLDAVYPPGSLIAPGGLAGRRVDADLGDGRRALDLVGRDAALVLFDDGRTPGWALGEVEAALDGVPGVKVHRMPASAWPQATGDTAALVRPDGYVGWMRRRPSTAELRAGVARALGAPADTHRLQPALGVGPVTRPGARSLQHP